jgi:hypothetical protein
MVDVKMSSTIFTKNHDKSKKKIMFDTDNHMVMVDKIFW